MANEEAIADAGYDSLKERALTLLLTDIADQQRTDIQDFVKAIDQKTVTAAEAKKVLDAIVEQSRQVAAPPAGFDFSRLNDALQSPPFYFFFGCFLLVVAFVTSEAELNTSLTFLVAMLGVAILLYGTGSQAAGSFGSNPELPARLLKENAHGASPPISETPAAEPVVVPPAATTTSPAPSGAISATAANLVIAGGAAVLTAFFGWGVIKYQGDIRQVFRDHDRYTKVRIEFCDAALTDCRDPDAAKNNTELALSKLSPETLREILRSTYLETGLGERAYGKQAGNGLEFIVFDRDIGEGRRIKLNGASATQDNTKYAADNGSYFALTSSKNDTAEHSCLVQTNSSDPCRLILMVGEGLDDERVRNMAVRATLSAESLLAESSDDPVVPR
jgi:hypothetical protein